MNNNVFKNYLVSLSTRQKAWLIISVLSAILIGIIGIISESNSTELPGQEFTTSMSIREIAVSLDITPKGLARELNLPLDIPKRQPLNKIGISDKQLEHAVDHILSHQSTRTKYFFFAAISLFGLIYLVQLGRPDNTGIYLRSLWYPRMLHIVSLVIAVVLCGFALGKSPNPMEGTVKVLKSMVGLYPSIIEKVLAFAFFIFLAVVGNKLICGWACPFGSLQELIYSIPLFHSIKKHKLPFVVTNVVRIGLFAVTLLILFGIIGNREGFVLYHYLNPFNLFDLHFEHWLILTAVIVFLILSIFIYRPFCHFVCPFGFVSWIMERFSLVKVNIDKEKCTKCGLCVQACPTQAAKDKVTGKLLGADCFSCARCLNVCPQDAIRYSSVFSKKN